MSEGRGLGAFCRIGFLCFLGGGDFIYSVLHGVINSAKKYEILSFSCTLHHFGISLRSRRAIPTRPISVEGLKIDQHEQAMSESVN